KNEIFMELIMDEKNIDIKNQYDSIRKAQDRDGFEKLIKETIEPMIEKEMKKLGKIGLSDETKKLYKEVGGAPHLDGQYTVFGRVYEGLNVIDSIASVKVNKSNRPDEDIIMNIKMIEE
ncbi:MAG: peptidylprolyl isomerase, partial [Bacteroidota bacterium]|nr:peptidylprolyl isomerase [Bacteroidota bacterium]